MRKLRMVTLLFLILGVLSLLYFLSIAFFTGHGTNFYFIWLIAGFVCLGIAMGIQTGFFSACVPRWLGVTVIAICSIGTLLFLIGEVCIISGFFQKGTKELDYVIVLGAQMKANGPSKSLRLRLDCAYDYLVENRDTKVIVSGGQGKDELVSEARGMYDYLVGRGISKDRILMEDQSVDTHENLVYSGKLLDQTRDRVGIISNDFHIFRAVRLAEHAGYQQVCGIAAASDPYLELNNMVREFLGLTKDLLQGNL